MQQADGTVTAGDVDFAERVLAEQFALRGRLDPLPGEHDLNYQVTATDGGRYLFKIHAANLSLGRADLQAAVLRHLEQSAPELPMPRLFLGRANTALATTTDAEGRERRLRLTTWLEGETWVDSRRRSGACWPASTKASRISTTPRSRLSTPGTWRMHRRCWATRR